MDIRRIAALVVLAALAAGAVVVSQRPAAVPGGPATPPPSAVTATTPAMPTPPASSPPAAAVEASVDPDCPVSRPDPPFRAPEPWPPTPPPVYQANWYGTPDLWTMLRHGGEVWTDLPLGPTGYVQKTFWFSVRWPYQEEPMPAIAVTGRRLDGPGVFQAGSPGTNAGASFGMAMLVGVEIPSLGCWEVTGTYRGAALSYIVWVGR